MGKILAIFACLGLAGCIAPPILTYASMALDGASLLTTGKTIGDHALSAAVDEDCALLRVVTEQDVEAVCREYANEDERKAAVAPTRVTAFMSMKGEVKPGKVPRPAALEPVALQPAIFKPATIEPAPILPVAAPTGMVKAGTRESAVENRSAIYLMIGNFPSQDGAEKLAARVSGLSTVVAPAMAGDTLYFRVVAGPIGPGETDAAQSRLAAMGIGNIWAANLCIRDLGAPPCDNEKSILRSISIDRR